ncbi:PLP-dependent aminotransferase family protein [Dactylosporangium sp. CA-092794]|uniref:aminotransferase-like domain-containing protein n=1 Tax=Dactylosporangium sp. CA-092794 TaxID=3239929 RepID=UPI003D8A8CF6
MVEPTSNPTQLLRYMLGPWHEASGPLYVLLADAIQRAVQSGQLPLGSRLPAERPLAEVLAISRTTVAAAYELLRQREVVARRQGAGTYVGYYGGGSLAARTMLGGGDAPQADPPDEIDFSNSAPMGDGVFPDGALAGLQAGFRRASQGHGYSAAGLPELRAAIAERLSRCGTPTTPEQVVVTTGAQQALYLCAQLFVRPGDLVVVEDPTWLGSIDAYRAARARVIGALLDREGARTAEYTEAVGRERIPVFHVSPSLNNPTGVIMSERRRRELVALAERNSTAIIEDNTLAELAFGPTPPPIAALEAKVPVLSIGSLSKVLWGGLRVGWVRADEKLIGRLSRIKLTVDQGGPVLDQLLAVELLRDIDAVRAARIEASRARLAVLEDELRAHLPSWSWDPPAGGLSLWVTLPQGDAVDFAAVARRHGVRVAPGPMLSPTTRMEQQLRLSFVQDPQALAEGARRLAQAWAQYLSSREDRRLPTLVG